MNQRIGVCSNGCSCNLQDRRIPDRPDAEEAAVVGDDAGFVVADAADVAPVADPAGEADGDDDDPDNTGDDAAPVDAVAVVADTLDPYKMDVAEELEEDAGMVVAAAGGLLEGIACSGSSGVAAKAGSEFAC